MVDGAQRDPLLHRGRQRGQRARPRLQPDRPLTQVTEPINTYGRRNNIQIDHHLHSRIFDLGYQIKFISSTIFPSCPEGAVRASC